MTKESSSLETDFLTLARLALTGRPQDVQLMLRRTASRRRSTNPGVAEAIIALLQEAPTRMSPLRRQMDTPVPVDVDSRLHLLHIEDHPDLNHEPVLVPEVAKALDLLVQERRNPGALQAMGLDPSRTALFVGPPGVGKTMAVRWLARALGKPLAILDLATVMSSYLGKTGTNLRRVLDYAKTVDCVLLLDELDAIAKRRDDHGEIGELKRLVTVLIQQIDDWPASGLLVAATNHPDLLDPAIWRRFEARIAFPLPDPDTIRFFVTDRLAPYTPSADAFARALSVVLKGASFSDLERTLESARRAAAVTGAPLNEHLAALLSCKGKPKSERIAVVDALLAAGTFSQRQISEWTGVSRTTLGARREKAITTEENDQAHVNPPRREAS